RSSRSCGSGCATSPTRMPSARGATRWSSSRSAGSASTGAGRPTSRYTSCRSRCCASYSAALREGAICMGAAIERWSTEWEESLAPRTRRILLSAVEEDVDENAHAVELRLLTTPSDDPTPDEREEPVRG